MANKGLILEYTSQMAKEARQALKGIADPKTLSKKSDPEAIRWALKVAEGRLTIGRMTAGLKKFYHKALELLKRANPCPRKNKPKRNGFLKKKGEIYVTIKPWWILKRYSQPGERWVVTSPQELGTGLFRMKSLKDGTTYHDVASGMSEHIMPLKKIKGKYKKNPLLLVAANPKYRGGYGKNQRRPSFYPELLPKGARWVQYLTREGKPLKDAGIAISLFRAEALRIKKLWEKMAPKHKYQLIRIKGSGWGVAGTPKAKSNPFVHIKNPSTVYPDEVYTITIDFHGTNQQLRKLPIHPGEGPYVENSWVSWDSMGWELKKVIKQVRRSSGVGDSITIIERDTKRTIAEDWPDVAKIRFSKAKSV